MTVLDQFSLTGRTALITGGSRGLGRAMAQAFAEAGADLIIVGRDRVALQTVQAEFASLGRTVDVITGDVGTPDGAGAVCSEALALNRPIDILLNNVGGRRIDVETEDFPISDWQQLMDLNLTSALVCCQMLGKPMLSRGYGSVINVTSIAGPIAMKGIRGRHYEAAKSALAALTRSLAADWASRGVRVNAIAPGVFETEPNKRWFGMKPEFRETFLNHIPMGRFGLPAELGPAAVFLASDASRYMTGATIVIDGGFTTW
jgi:NAD(P)-dependent dehydrogenase (short-subunit alcohol dehydrogenase family)